MVKIKAKVFPASTAVALQKQLDDWLEKNQRIKPLLMSQREYVLTLLYEDASGIR